MEFNEKISGNGIMFFCREQQYTKYIEDPYTQKS